MFSPFLHSQNTELEATIIKHDSAFWEGYNNCNIKRFKNYISDDFEFYHDKGGLTKGSDEFILAIEEGLCNKNNDQKLRREVVKNSTNVYALDSYGAIITGDHVFYLKVADQEERLIESAKFTHVWQLKDNQWNMTRVLSYNHKKISENTYKKEILLEDEVLNTFVGNYKTQNIGLITISKLDGQLHLDAGKMQTTIYAESASFFFHKETPLTFEFIKNDADGIIKMIVREQGHIVEEAIKD
jgi:hypothetical protein